MRRQTAQRTCLKIEQLEARELMAADLHHLGADRIADCPLSTRQLTVAAGTSGTATQPTASRTTSILIPIAAAEPRSYDGTGNNLANPELGSTGEQLLRVADAEYGDGISTPAGADRPSPREISNALVAQDEETPERSASSRRSSTSGASSSTTTWTSPSRPRRARRRSTSPCRPTIRYFDPDGTGTQVIGLNRSRYDATTGTSVDNPREQINQITAWIDGSMVYGSDKATADSLRTFVGGKLRTSDGNLPPTDAAGNFLAGDVRANENVELTSMHTLFVREHNWWATQIARQNPRLSDEQIYQQARAIVIAEIQSSPTTSFCPPCWAQARSVRTGATMRRSIRASPTSSRPPRSACTASSTTTWSSSATTAGPSATKSSWPRRSSIPDLLRETGIDPILKYLASTHAQEDRQADRRQPAELPLRPAGAGRASIWRRSTSSAAATTAWPTTTRSARRTASRGSRRFAEITSDPEVQQTLETLYGTVDNIDLWVGGLAEDHVPGASVGETIRTIVADQFERLRDGDRFWYREYLLGPAIAADREHVALRHHQPQHDDQQPAGERVLLASRSCRARCTSTPTATAARTAARRACPVSRSSC